MNHTHTRDREAAQRWARALLARSDWVVLDTETTGLDGRDEVIQIAIVADDRSVLMDTLVRPQSRIPARATAIHGITDDMVAHAPTFPEIFPQLAAILEGKLAICYNAAFDSRLLQQTAARNKIGWPSVQWDCAMEQYARYFGQWSERNRSYQWQKLPRSKEYEHEKHQAIHDCLATLDLIRSMAGTTGVQKRLL
ncbi:MAG: 3'-5' exonuclease [Chloroflexota bacterium]|nr:MAG: 3'-5' exonuclease [Chloroflexota bacterium]